ncbi:ATP-binding cassette domain-containing protein [Desulfopila aestuarii]|uniref:Putative thiamine transport system ATP-binding protein n=1 Tax=Desulfopila aestuarii DSM 18488 TaxID=1121416 RepID=A0A1M7Y8Q5_9BACT|nr:ATP-binding cassette domain-containing protein [Desulfopila aestuarii]SHO49025.1 putative thiamine transport system ATP-binding protein [Desulfopila aestuarii DSM 18488]
MSLQLEGLQITFKGRRLFAPVTLAIPNGEIATVMGPSGCGKSTLLAAIAGNLEHGFSVSGRIVLNGRELNGTRMEERRVGILFQDDLLFPHFDVYGNLAFGVSGKLDKKERRQRILEALERTGLADFAHRDVATLSGGQKARVSLLRTMLAEPEAVLLDEPFSKLDKPLRASFRDFVREQVAQLTIPALLVTHDEEDSCGGIICRLGGEEDR